MKVAPLLLLFLVFILLELPNAESKRSKKCAKERKTIAVLRKYLVNCQRNIAALRRIVKKPHGSCYKPSVKRLFMNGGLMYSKHTADGCMVTECWKGKPRARTICKPPKVDKVHWSYNGSHGPSHWKDLKGYSACGYHRQSPIDIVGAVPDATIPPLQFQGYNIPASQITLGNNGHAAGLFFDLNNDPEMTGGALPGTFIFHHIHFHWGSVSTQGSEHTIGGQEYPMEMHAVHYNKKYGDIGAAVASGMGDGLAVLGFLFTISPTDNTDFQPIIDGLSRIQANGDAYFLPSLFSVDSLFSDTSKFYRYNGSLTTPACNQVVTWTVLKETIDISETQMFQFRQLKDEYNQPMVNNYRPVQPLFGRTILEV